VKIRFEFIWQTRSACSKLCFLQPRYDRYAISFILHTHHSESDCIIGLLFDSPSVNKEIKRRPSYLGHVVAIRGACSQSVPLKCCQMRGVSNNFYFSSNTKAEFFRTLTQKKLTCRRKNLLHNMRRKLIASESRELSNIRQHTAPAPIR